MKASSASDGAAAATASSRYPRVLWAARSIAAAEQLATFDKIYAGDRPRYIDGYKKLKAAIRPWGA